MKLETNRPTGLFCGCGGMYLATDTYEGEGMNECEIVICQKCGHKNGLNLVHISM